MGNIGEAQTSSFNQCPLFNASVTVTSISSPLTINSYVKLYTNINKTPLTNSIDCVNYMLAFNAICNNSTQLEKCNQDRLVIFLSNYVNQMVIIDFINLLISREYI